jgi:hypothetical protein
MVREAAMTTWTPEAIAWHDRILRQKREREAELRQLLGWSNANVGLYTIDTFLPPPRYSSATTGHSSTSKRSAKLAQKRQTHKKEVNANA